MVSGMTGDEFREWRERLQLTQAKVAEMLEVSEMTVYRWENNKVPILRTVELALKQLETEQKERIS